LVIMGGDGTLNDLVNGLLLKKQAERNIDVNDHHAALDQLDIPISFIPAGTGNGMANILYGCVDVVTSTLHLVKGGIKDYPVFGNFCEKKLVAYSFMMAAYGLFADLIHSVDSQRWLKKLRYLVVPIWFFLFKGLRNFDAELTFEYTQKKKEDKQKSSNPEQALETETEHMTLMNVMALIDKIAFGVDDGLSDDESNKLEFGKEFGLMIYKPAGRFAMIKHFIQLGKAASKEFIDRCDFLSFKVVKALTIRIPKSESDMDLLINLDGQIYKLTKPEIYITTTKHRAIKRLKNALPRTPKRRSATLAAYLQHTKSPAVEILRQAEVVSSPEDLMNMSIEKAALEDIKTAIESCKTKRSKDSVLSMNVLVASISGEKITETRCRKNLAKKLGLPVRRLSRGNRNRTTILKSEKSCWAYVCRKTRKDALSEETKRLAYNFWMKPGISRPTGNKADVKRERIGPKIYTCHQVYLLEKTQTEVTLISQQTIHV
ncbi:Hypothetical predicted protein, partial [Mytilus galloprovincialis]